MKDEELIEYCTFHCHTPRALFHVAHVRRMFELAGDKKVLAHFDDLHLQGFVAVHAEAMEPLVHAVRMSVQKEDHEKTRRHPQH